MREPITHELKTWPGPFIEVLEGRKRHELRKADRDFRVGDRLHLREWIPEPETGPARYTGRELLVEVTHVTKANDFVPILGDDPHVVMSIEPGPSAEVGRRGDAS